MTTMELEHCDKCGCELEASQIGACEDCATERDHETEGRHAEDALNRFVNTTGIGRADALADMLESMMHWCLANGFDFSMELDRATENFLN